MKRMGGGANRRQAKKEAEEEKNKSNEPDTNDYKFRLNIEYKKIQESDE